MSNRALPPCAAAGVWGSGWRCGAGSKEPKCRVPQLRLPHTPTSSAKVGRDKGKESRLQGKSQAEVRADSGATALCRSVSGCERAPRSFSRHAGRRGGRASRAGRAGSVLPAAIGPPDAPRRPAAFRAGLQSSRSSSLERPCIRCCPWG
ncbi:hypothetical protein COCON_G00148630 [Conger conger]|uniref:Uncharacterized protein n=1 Tax=Conger conger TaxID=82655 RepID=A0A9Q1DCT8_CONCO|nr:hypothetical protein COCON_G00148630 [Conger conger]